MLRSAMNRLDAIEKDYTKKKIPPIRSGDTVRVHTRIVEGNKERIQIFEGVVLRLRGSGSRRTMTVRKVSYGVGVERIFPIHSPVVAQIEFVSRGRVRQSRIYYLRQLFGKKSRLAKDTSFTLKETDTKAGEDSKTTQETPEQDLSE